MTLTQTDPTRDALRRWARTVREVCDLLAEIAEREEAEQTERGLGTLLRRGRGRRRAG